jgi:hypothetical protein
MKGSSCLRALLLLTVCGSGAAAMDQPRIGFIDPSLPKEMSRRNAAAFAFAKSVGETTRLRPADGGGWQTAGDEVRAPEEFDVVWYHEGDDSGAASLTEKSRQDLLAYVEEGGSLLLSGAAGRLLNDLAIEPTPLRVLGPTEAAFLTGIRVGPKHRTHPAFAGLDTTKPILLTSLGGNALADFYGTPGPHGQLLAEGSAGQGERPLVEYSVGRGRVIFVGWRLPDFTTAGDPHRPNLERLFRNLLGHLAQGNTNRARMVRPAGKSQYSRVLGVPFLRAAKPFAVNEAPQTGEVSAALLTTETAAGAFPADGTTVREVRLDGKPLAAAALAATLLRRQHPVSQFVARQRAQQAAMDEHDKQRTAGLRVIRPPVKLVPGPLRPLQTPRVDQSVLLGRSPFMAPGDGRGDATPVYEPLEDGGFRMAKGTRRLNRPIVHGQNRVWTGDRPIFRMDTVTGNGSYAAQERVFPLWPRPDAAVGNVNPCMGTLRLAVPDAAGTLRWLDELPEVTATFRPGYTEYELKDPRAGWKASLRVAPALDFHGLVCRVEFDREVPLAWQYGGVWWQPAEANANRAEVRGGEVRITEPNLPNGLVLAGWDGHGAGRVEKTPFGQQAVFVASEGRRVFHLAAAWGVADYDRQRAQKTLARLDTAIAAPWPEARDRLKQSWLDCYVRRALDPEQHFRMLLASPEKELRRTCEWWDRRREEFQVRTPDAHLSALVNWTRATSEYHRQGPGLVLGAQIWQMYSHISTGWYGKQWGGDHQTIEECLRFYGAMQADDGFLRWISPSLVAFYAENNTPYWVDQVWWHYAWTGDRQLVRDLWPAVRKAVAWQRKRNDPDGDGLFRDGYEYWNCDSNGKGPKAAAPSAMSWAMLDRAARLAAVVGDADAEKEYRALAEKTRTEVFQQLWREEEGRLGSIGADEIWRGHPQTWEEYLAVNAGLLSPVQGRRAMRWIASHYGFQPQPGVQLLACSDWWPIRWSVQWVPTGDTCLAALAGMKSGDADLWWPYLKTVVGSAFRSEFPGINMGIANTGAGGGDREDVDSVDPHLHAAVRGLFGIEPALHEGRIDICPAFPSAWQQASIRAPDVSYEYRRQGDRATYRIRTPKALIKRVRGNLDGPETVTPREEESIVTVNLGPAPPPPKPAEEPPILVETAEKSPKRPKRSPVQRSRLVLVDLSKTCNVTVEEMIATPFVFDYADGPQPLVSWWGNPTITLPPSPRVVETAEGLCFLTSGRPRPGVEKPPKGLLALSSWRPHPLPAAAVVPVGMKCRSVFLLLQSYVHPMKNYIPNGEVVLHYADGRQSVESLVPPFNLDCYFQHFSLRGTPVPLGQLGAWPIGWSPVPQEASSAHADALEIACDPGRPLESVELRATCSEGVLGLAAMSLLAAEDGRTAPGAGPATSQAKDK